MNDFINNNSDLFEIQKYKRNDMIFCEGDICNKLGYVVNGNIHISTVNYDETEFIISRLNTNDFFGETLIFSNSPYYLGDVVAFSEVTICLINRKNLLYLLQNNESFLTFFISSMAKKNFYAQNRLKVLSQNSIRNKIMFFLYNQEKIYKKRIIEISSKENLARLLNMPRPSLSRELSKLRKDGIIEYTKTYIKIIKD